MSLTYFLVSRHWASSRLRTALTVFGIALGVAIVVAIYVMDHNTIASRLRDQAQDQGPVDLVVTPRVASRATEQVRADLRRRDGVAEVAVWRQALAELHAHDDGIVLEVAAFGLDPLPTGAFAHYVVADGQDLAPADGDGAVLLGQEAARLLGVGVGGRLVIAEPANSQRVECKDGELRVIPRPAGTPQFRAEVTVKGLLTFDRVGRRNFGQVAVCSHALGERLLPQGPVQFQLQRVPGADLDRLRARLLDDYYVQNLRAAMIGEGADERAFRNGLKVLGCLALLLGMFSVFQTLSQSLVARVHKLGLLRCLGLGRAGLMRVFLGDALLLSVCGSLLGVGGGLLLALLLRHWQVSSLGLGKEWHTFAVPVLPVVWTAALGVLFTLAGALFPLWRARSVPAMRVLQSRGLSGPDAGFDLMRGVNLWLFLLLVLVLPLAYLAMTPLVSEEGRETLWVLAELAALLLAFGGLLLLAPALVVALGKALLWPWRAVLGLPGFLLGKLLHQRPARLAAAVCGFGAVLLALLGLKCITESLRAEVWQFAAAALDRRVFLEGDPLTPAAARTLAALPGVVGVEPQEGVVTPGFVLSGLSVEAVTAPGGALERYPELVQRYVDSERRTLVASTRLAAKLGWRTGTTVPLHDRNGVPQAYDVLLVSDRSGYQPASDRTWAVTAPHWLHRDFCVGATCVERTTLRLEPGADPRIVADRAAQVLPGAASRHRRTGDWIRSYQLFDVGRDFVLFDVLLFLILVLAAVGLLNGMTIAALGRVREIGVLRALGVGTRSLRATFLLEGALVGLLGALLALALCVPVANLLILGLNQVAGLEAPVALPVRWLVAVPVIAVATGLLAAVVPGMRAARISPAAAVRYE